MPGCPIPEFKINTYRCSVPNTLRGEDKAMKLASTINVSASNDDASLYAALLKPSGRRLTCKNMLFENKTLNAFKRWEGAPGGSGARILNVF